MSFYQEGDIVFIKDNCISANWCRGKWGLIIKKENYSWRVITFNISELINYDPGIVLLESERIPKEYVGLKWCAFSERQFDDFVLRNGELIRKEI